MSAEQESKGRHSQTHRAFLYWVASVLPCGWHNLATRACRWSREIFRQRFGTLVQGRHCSPPSRSAQFEPDRIGQMLGTGPEQMEAEIKIRRATTDHAKGISGVICSAIEQTNAKDYPPTVIGRLIGNFSTAKVEKLLTERLTFIALVDEIVVGTGALQEAEIRSVFVSPAHHRTGIGTFW